ncbi:MAG: hypothetical protein CMJ89_02300 [Planctomycetes bacterium]|nr:hypothetical protein [Planctomycetota bacterium]
MHSFRSATASIALLGVLASLAPALGAQKLARKYFEDSHNGYRVKPLGEFIIVPPKPEDVERGYIAKMSGKENYVHTAGGDDVAVKPGLDILRFGDELKGEVEEGRSQSTERKAIEGYLDRIYKGLNPKKPLIDEQKKIKSLMARHRRWEAKTPRFNIKQFVDLWTFELNDADIHLVYRVHDKKSKKYLKVFAKSAKTFSEIKRTESAELGEASSYAELLSFHEEDAFRIPGWRALPTDSEKFIIKTSSENRKFIKEVITRLEKSRLLYEKDFPPPPGFDHVSIVRICGTEEEFHQYGGTGGGVAGWFNPRTTELVLYDAVSLDRNMTYAVMSHEAFHQYCHFLFEESEAHRWFDEGHGDYYGGVKFKGRKSEVTSKMPAGLNRLSVIKDMVRNGTYKPLEDHLNYDHGEWQGQGPSPVSCYAQSWSIIYMLRQGTLGKVNRRVWKKEYARIIPAYVTTLADGFAEAYAELLEEREADALGDERELTEEEKHINRNDLAAGQKEEIWTKAIEASWGEIDLQEFEANWVTYIEEHLK